MGNLIEPLDPIHWYGLNLNPVPLEFSQEFDTWKVLSAILARISLIEKTINEMEKTWQEYTDEEIEKLNEAIQAVIDDTKRALVRLIELNRTEVEERITQVHSDLIAEMLEHEINVQEELAQHTQDMLGIIAGHVSDLEAEDERLQDVIDDLSDRHDAEFAALDTKINQNKADLDSDIADLILRIIALETTTAGKDYTDAEIAKLRNEMIALGNALTATIADVNHRCDIIQSQIRELERIVEHGSILVVSPVTGKMMSVEDALAELYDYLREWVTYGEADNTGKTYNDMDYANSEDAEKQKVTYQMFNWFMASYLGVDFESVVVKRRV